MGVKEGMGSGGSDFPFLFIILCLSFFFND